MLKLGLALSLVASVAFSSPLTVAEKNSDIDQLASLIKSQYAPLQLKGKQIGLQLPLLVEAYKDRAEKLSNKDFYYLLNQFVAEFRDGHFKATVKTDHKSTLGFVSDIVGNEVVIENSALPPFLFPGTRGDIVVSLDGVPAMEAVKDLEKYIGVPHDKTRRRLAAFQLTWRSSSMVPPENGQVEGGHQVA